MTQDITKQMELEASSEKNESRHNEMIFQLNQQSKKLSCMYKVTRLLKGTTRPLEDIFIDITKTLPDGWQFPEDMRCKIVSAAIK